MLLRVSALVIVATTAVRAWAPPSMPSPQQLRWLDDQVGAMITYNMQTYSSSMSVGRVVNATSFRPSLTEIADSWLAASSAFGAKYGVLTTDHFSGFNLWPSTSWPDKHAPYTTAQSGWASPQDGADLVAQFARVFREGGLRAGAYYSVHNNWAWNVSNFVTKNPAQQQAFNDFALAQLTELLGGVYGDWAEVWFDAGVMSDVNPAIGPLVQKLAPNSVCHSCDGFAGASGIRWVGNENGVAPLPNWLPVASEDACAGKPHGSDPNGSVFCPPSCDTVLGAGSSWHFWFWREHTAADLKSVEELVATYLNSVGRSCNLILNLAPDPSGALPSADMQRYQEMGAAIAALTNTLVANASDVALVPAGGRTVAGAMNLTATLTLPLPASMPNATVIVREDLARQGQRVASHEVWLLASSGAADPTWTRLAASSTVGAQRIYVAGAADDVSEGSSIPSSARFASWPLSVYEVQVRVLAVPEGFAPPSSLRSVALYAHRGSSAAV